MPAGTTAPGSRTLLGSSRSAQAVALVAAACAGPTIAAAAQDGVAGDRAALVAFYDATGGPEWTDGTNWTSDDPLDAWHGVTTDTDGRVAGLTLPGNNLAGTLPATLENLTRLRQLALGGNRFSGSIPPGLGNLVDLQELSLWNEDDYTGSRGRRPDRRDPGRAGEPRRPHAAGSQGQRPDRPDPAGPGQPDRPPGTHPGAQRIDRRDPGRAGEPDQPPLAGPRPQPVDGGAAGRPGAPHQPLHAGYGPTAPTGRPTIRSTRGTA